MITLAFFSDNPRTLNALDNDGTVWISCFDRNTNTKAVIFMKLDEALTIRDQLTEIINRNSPTPLATTPVAETETTKT